MFTPKQPKYIFTLESEFELKYDVLTHQPETLIPEHIKLIAEINETAFHDSNDLIDNMSGLKTAFKNARSQARYKKKIGSLITNVSF
ncbi:hypothetical protein [Moritella sp.]|uniref:hypothetical protein n=1 Tax=Moritella sp. TaxID=78556 RepID=UPI0025FDD97B|nr:hypothetical protein [Moritella sp.]